ncbi:phage tail assembly protein [Novacetimonas hansenii]|uniref:Uncharacterized protein n=1 Tax=Novacetimonas hansenii TaxID=436 RepID=A0ABQ0SH40_NOVHA|nr:phage tail assembly protein [Novacetimonas hansenii]GAN84053.1 hypothetical protein Gaha_0122_053 [Novacetimonas hansenii JCM 7643]GBQ55886.1 hypothetical protein AA0243_1041 [Novacetimonas hansenii NRIC 0243]GEC64578.1 hypothetical protein GHA01_24270 [Novacetimonas hansenii]
MTKKNVKVIKFDEIEVGGVKYDNVTVRKPTFGEKYLPQKKFKTTPPSPEEFLDYQIQLACKITDLPVEVFMQLESNVGEEIIDFLN